MNLQEMLDKLEAVVADDAAEEMCIKAAFPGRINKGDYKEAVAKISLIYRIVHSWNPKHSCHYVHDDWRAI